MQSHHRANAGTFYQVLIFPAFLTGVAKVIIFMSDQIVPLTWKLVSMKITVLCPLFCSRSCCFIRRRQKFLGEEGSWSLRQVWGLHKESMRQVMGQGNTRNVCHKSSSGSFAGGCKVVEEVAYRRPSCRRGGVQDWANIRCPASSTPPSPRHVLAQLTEEANQSV